MAESDQSVGLRITVTRAGGVGGLSPRWTVEAQEEPDISEWLDLVESCPWDEGPEPEETGADRFVYTIRVLVGSEVGASQKPGEPVERDARIPETALNGAWRALVTRVKDTARR